MGTVDIMSIHHVPGAFLIPIHYPLCAWKTSNRQLTLRLLAPKSHWKHWILRFQDTCVGPQPSGCKTTLKRERARRGRKEAHLNQLVLKAYLCSTSHGLGGYVQRFHWQAHSLQSIYLPHSIWAGMRWTPSNLASRPTWHPVKVYIVAARS